jgi:FAD/FMN-containing dehydrogenase
MKKNHLYRSWGLKEASNQEAFTLERQDFDLQKFTKKILAFANGRSYGDICLNSNGIVLDTKNWNQFIDFDFENGYLKAYSGVLLSDILKLIIPKGWFLPVLPGTKYISLGGAIANDIHGKNHHHAGTFGLHLEEFEILKSNGERLICNASNNSDLFRATIGGMGLTGLIIWAKIKLKKITNSFLNLELIKFYSFEEFLNLSIDSDKKFEYTVAWIDSFANNSLELRGIFMRANHDTNHMNNQQAKIREYNLPFEIPFSLVNNFTTKIFNYLYFNKQISKKIITKIDYNSFFFPLDLVSNWNLLYGPKGFTQLQFVCPLKNINSLLDEVFGLITKYHLSSPLSVLKVFGAIQSPGLLSFPREGITLAMDFPSSNKNLELFLTEALKQIYKHEGIVYPAKDTHLEKSLFQESFKSLDEFKKNKDPNFCSDFWRRVND